MSIKNRLPLTCGVLLLLLVAPLTAAAADFTFNVPVNLENQNIEITQGEVHCSIVREDATREFQMGEGVQFFTLDSLGNFQGTLTVAFDVNAEEDPVLASSYTCILSLQDINGGVVTPPKSLGERFRATGLIRNR
jgi:hypothetical protein